MQCLTTEHTQLGSRQPSRQQNAPVGAFTPSSVLPTSLQSCQQRLGWQQQQLSQGRWQQQWQQPHQQWQQPHCRSSSRAAVVPAAWPPEHIDAAGGKKRLAVFVSGGGSNFKAIHAACQRGAINAEVVVSRQTAADAAHPVPATPQSPLNQAATNQVFIPLPPPACLPSPCPARLS